MVSNGYHILRRIFFPILRHKYIFYACIMFGNSVLVDKFQGINNILLFQLWYSVFSFNSDRIRYSRRSACVMFCSFLRAFYLSGKKNPTVMSR